MGTLGSAMNSSPSAHISTERGDWLDALLVQDALESPYIDDAGFTTTLMQRLPSPAALPAWRKPIVMLLWLVAGVLVAVMLPQAIQDLAREAIRAHVEKGRVDAVLTIDEQGNVTDVRIVNSNPPRVFDRVVQDTLSEWKCVGEGSRYQASVEINFTLKDE